MRCATVCAMDPELRTIYFNLSRRDEGDWDVVERALARLATYVVADFARSKHETACVTEGARVDALVTFLLEYLGTQGVRIDDTHLDQPTGRVYGYLDFEDMASHILEFLSV